MSRTATSNDDGGTAAESEPGGAAVTTPRVLVVHVGPDSAGRAARLSQDLSTSLGGPRVNCCHLSEVARGVDRDSIDVYVVVQAEPDAQCVAVRTLKRMPDPLPVLVEADTADRSTLVGLVRAGADGVVPVHSPVETLSRCISAAVRGEFVLPRNAVRHLAVEVRLGTVQWDRTHGALRELSRRQREVLTLLYLDLGTEEVAERLFVSPETVRFHVHTAVRKLGLRSREDLFRLLDQSVESALRD